jgi:hypothetical protein
MPVEKTGVEEKEERGPGTIPVARTKAGPKAVMTQEERILKALHVPPPGDAQVHRASFKIEVHWGKDRTVSGPNTGAILIWESGRRFHGGGDDKMYWCGYVPSAGFTGADACGLPIRTEFFSQFHVVCPHCQRECFLDPATRQQFLATKGLARGKQETMAAMPMVFGEKMFKATPKRVSEELATVFRQLGSDADVYMKFHPSDIRCRSIEGDAKKVEAYRKARRERNDGLLIYSYKRLMRDLAAGATLESRFLAMCVA